MQTTSFTVPTGLTIRPFDKNIIPKGGVKLSYFTEFIGSCGGRDALIGKSTIDICNEFVKTMTSQYQCSLCDILEASNHPLFATKSDVFISHAWKYEFLDFVDILEYHFRDRPDVSIWFELFTNNQHQAPELDFDWWATTYKTVIKDFNHTVMVLMPWQDPIPLKRCWCLYDLYFTYEMGCRFEVAMGQKGYREFIETVESGDKSASEVVNKMLATIDVSNSESFNPEDKRIILTIVDKEVGLSTLNGVVLSLMRDWVVDVYESEISRRKVELGDNHPGTLSAMHNLASLYENQGKYAEAEPLYVDCFAKRKIILGGNHPDTLSSMHSVALVYKKQGRIVEAEPVSVECLAKRKVVLGDNHHDTLSSMHCMALLYEKQGRFAEAEALSVDCLSKYKAMFGDDHPDTLSSMHSLGALYEKQGRIADAELLYVDCLAKRKVSLGDNHPDTLSSMHSLGALYEKQGRIADAELLYVDCLGKRKVSLGDNHPDTLSSMHSFGALYEKQGKYAEAEPLYVACLANRKVLWGDYHPDTLSTMLSVASLYEKQGKYLEAEALQTEYRAKREKAALQRALQRGKKEWGRSKIMIVGEGGAGKTALSNSIIGKPFKDTSSTVGINHISCDVRFATIGNGDNGGEWGEFSKPDKETEAALAQMILNEGRKPAPVTRKRIPTVKAVPPQYGAVLASNTAIERQEIGRSAQTDAEDSRMKNSYIGKDNSDAQHSEAIQSSISIPTSTPSKPSALPVVTAAVDDELVMKCLATSIQTHTKYIISLFDFGGQSVFNVIHPFFLTRYGVYVLVFNMEWLTPADWDHVTAAEEAKRQECLSYLKFWVNSVVIHTRNDNNDTAPIAFVGTRKDSVSNPQGHQLISTLLFETFKHNIAWPNVLENRRVDGAVDLHFFPVDNTQSRDDPTMKKLLQVVEQRIDDSDYVHEEKPLSWLQLLDQMTASGETYLSFDRVEELTASCGVPSEEVPMLLDFFHQMGMLMWYDDPGLRNVIILDPIEYFVKPATIVICCHARSENFNKHTHHFLDIHEECKKKHFAEFSRMVTSGVVSESLLAALLSYYSQRVTIVQLMIKYGLLVSLAWSQRDSLTSQPASQNYLAPALLPQGYPGNVFAAVFAGVRDRWADLPVASFAFVFSAVNGLEMQSTVTATDMKEQGFLPSGLFERLICKAVSWSQQTADWFLKMEVLQLTKNEAILLFGNRRFRLTPRPDYNCIQVDVEGVSPVAVHERLRGQLETIIAECMKSLRFFTSQKTGAHTDGFN